MVAWLGVVIAAPGGPVHALSEFAVATPESEARFVIATMLGPIGGTLGRFSGRVVVDESRKRIEAVLIEVALEDARADHFFADWAMRQPFFFDVANHPTARFSAAAQTFDPAQGGLLKGRFDLKGSSRAVRLIVAPARAVDGSWLFRARTTIDRRDFGMTAFAAFVEPIVQLDLEIVLVPRAGGR